MNNLLKTIFLITVMSSSTAFSQESPLGFENLNVEVSLWEYRAEGELLNVIKVCGFGVHIPKYIELNNKESTVVTDHIGCFSVLHKADINQVSQTATMSVRGHNQSPLYVAFTPISH